ncbi:conserved hypothetical protein [Desulfamplus magnetovallimortis]|uniref:Putative nickel insertion protein n=1 Tax=Desulfamplus magnetovallimortis TaxID=1246637 RepID=A0A1W1HD67_9BACT|nr:nickel pincer cofactor biosynthesis protein LarC [Desulfamplus magnetovallimortis]SLM30315.1 conserved hypothetical protein [Desulfamplus magnetovallimortis]
MSDTMIAYFDMFSGISGDMTLGACLSLGVPAEWLNRQFEKIPLLGVKIRREDVIRNGISAVKLFVDESHHSHTLDELQRLDKLEKEYASEASSHSHSRNFEQIKSLIFNAPFSEYVISSSVAAFKKIAVAESAIHGVPLEKIHFHEVGGVDAIVDIVGTFLCMEYLGIQEVYASMIPLGNGSVTCSHGAIPVPAPATIKILEGVPVKASGNAFEMVTPTGAAIITTLASSFGDIPDMVIAGSGYGSGTYESKSGLPNLLRIITGRKPAPKAIENEYIFYEKVCVLTTIIDDMNPEVYGFLMEKLFVSGALDVSWTPAQMKKNRPGNRIEVICKKESLDSMIHVILTETTTTGVRFDIVNRAFLERCTIDVETVFGKIAAKEIKEPSGAVRIVPEYDICHKIAHEKNIPLHEVYREIMAATLT